MRSSSRLKNWMLLLCIALVLHSNVLKRMYADRGDLPLQFYSQAPSIVDVRHFEKALDKNFPV